MKNYNLTHLEQLEAEAIFVLRETAAQFERPGLLFSGGKDSIVMAHLAYKAFFPAKSPFPLVHVDTGHNFPETIEFRDRFVDKIGSQLIVGLVQDSIDQGTAVEETGPNASRNALQSVTLLETIESKVWMLPLEVAVEMKKKREPKSVFSLTAMHLDNGIPKTSVLNCGIFSMVEKARVNTFGFFP